MKPRWPERGNYAPCECTRAQEERAEECGGCEEFRAARDRWNAYEECRGDYEYDAIKDDELLGRGR
jgi:hypothetical protein